MLLWFMSENVLCSLLGFLWCYVLYLSHFVFIVVYDVRTCSNFTDLHEVFQIFHLLKRLSFLHYIFLHPLL